MSSSRVWPSHGRILNVLPGEATWNMALDQAIMETTDGLVASGSSEPATLRFYSWSTPTLSLGYFQSAKSVPSNLANNRTNESRHIELVRRSTGGGAIVHHHDLTYSLTIPARAGDSGARTEVYRLVHQAIAAALADHSVIARPYRLDRRVSGNPERFLCFQRRTDEDLILHGYKIAGSAQRRTRHALLQHGSLLLTSSSFASELPGISDLTGRTIEAAPLSESITRHISRLTDINFQLGQNSDQENQLASQIKQSRYENQTWWNRR